MAKIDVTVEKSWTGSTFYFFAQWRYLVFRQKDLTKIFRQLRPKVETGFKRWISNGSQRQVRCNILTLPDMRWCRRWDLKLNHWYCWLLNPRCVSMSPKKVKLDLNFHLFCGIECYFAINSQKENLQGRETGFQTTVVKQNLSKCILKILFTGYK